MKRTKNVKKHASRKTSTAITVAAAIIASVVMTSIWQIPQATASSLEEIKASRDISSSIDQVWNVVSNIDNETKYWSTFKAIKNINKTAINMTANTTEGPVTGTRTLALSPSSNVNTTKIDVLWNVDMSGIPFFGRGFAKDGIMRTTEEALSNIAAEVQVR